LLSVWLSVCFPQYGIDGMIERQALVDELAEIVFDGKLHKMEYFRKNIFQLTDVETIEFFKKVDAIFQRYAENI